MELNTDDIATNKLYKRTGLSYNTNYLNKISKYKGKKKEHETQTCTRNPNATHWLLMTCNTTTITACYPNLANQMF